MMTKDEYIEKLRIELDYVITSLVNPDIISSIYLEYLNNLINFDTNNLRENNEQLH